MYDWYQKQLCEEYFYFLSEFVVLVHELILLRLGVLKIE